MTEEIEEIIKNVEKYKQMELIKATATHLCKDHGKKYPMACNSVTSTEREQKEALSEIKKNLKTLERKIK